MNPYCGSNKPHSQHNRCPGMLSHAELIDLYLESDKNDWGARFSYSNWRGQVERTMNWSIR